ncbi:MAG: hypothetical protein HGB12_13170, partial [Bacteroidetes bacterium]|nr:hypothetical protein [Bacteroidota bacterium]
MIKKIISILFLLIINSFVFAQSEKRTYTASRCAINPKIDGVLDDAAWKQAAIATGMYQLRPDQGKKAQYETEVKIIYN